MGAWTGPEDAPGGRYVRVFRKAQAGHRGVRPGRVATIATVGAGVADSLHSAMADAYISSPLLEQNRFLLRLDDEGVAQAVAQLRPTLSFVASANRDLVERHHDVDRKSRGRMGALCRQQPPPCDRGCARNREGRAAGPRAVEQQVLLDAVTAYLNVWRDTQVVGVREANVRVVTQQLRAARDRFEVGEDTRTDVAQAEARLAQARSALAAARGQLEISRELFRARCRPSPRRRCPVPARCPGCPAARPRPTTSPGRTRRRSCASSMR
jgi:hypothetical protein